MPKPSLPKITAPVLEKEQNIPSPSNPAEVASVHQVSTPVHPFPKQEHLQVLTKCMEPSSIHLHPAYNPESIKKMTKGDRFIHYLKDIKKNLPSLWKVLIVVLIGLLVPVILPALGALAPLGVV
jgi:hypothetical protein